MEKPKENLNRTVKKKGRKHKKGLFDKTIKYTEKILLPLAVIFLTFQYIFLTNKLDKAQETISQISHTDKVEGNSESEKSLSDYVNLNTIAQSVDNTSPPRNSPATTAKPTIKLDDSEAIISSAFDVNAEMAEPTDYFAQESDKVSKYFSSYKPQVSESGSNNDDDKNFIEAQAAMADIINKVADKSHTENRDQLKIEFWQLYWNDKLSYDNPNFEYLVLKFGKQLNIDDSNFANLSSISNKIQAELDSKTINTFWVEDEMNNLRIN